MGAASGAAPGGGSPADPLATPANSGSEQIGWHKGVVEEDIGLLAVGAVLLVGQAGAF